MAGNKGVEKLQVWEPVCGTRETMACVYMAGVAGVKGSREMNQRRACMKARAEWWWCVCKGGGVWEEGKRQGNR